MSKDLIVKKVAEKTGITQTKANEVLNAMLETIKGQLKKGEEVRFTGFGSFKISKRAATTGRNPQTGAPIKIPARKTVKFSVGKDLKEAVN